MDIKIVIGADEIILWLRKNRKAMKKPNDGTYGLGQLIHEMIVNQLNGKKIADNSPSYWAHLNNDLNIGEYNLPKTSAQYELSTEKLSILYEIITTW